MANSATAKAVIKTKVAENLILSVTPYVVVIDTISTDLTVFTPTANHFWLLCGFTYTGASNDIMFKSGGNVHASIRVVNNFNYHHKLGDGILLYGGAVDETLDINCSATIDAGVFYVAEVPGLNET